jgi:UDPglucose 6-dehydrogenase
MAGTKPGIRRLAERPPRGIVNAGIRPPDEAGLSIEGEESQLDRRNGRGRQVPARKPTLGVMGAGWVGLVTAACFAERGHRVVVRDISAARVQELDAGGLNSIYEPGLAELIVEQRDRLTFTLDALEVFSEARIVFVCVGTPPTYSGDADLSAVWTLLRELPPDLEPTTLVMKSTVPVGTGERVRLELEGRGLEQVGYVSNPEFLAEGTALRDARQPSRIVIGAFDQERGDSVAGLYEGLEAPILRTDVSSAEMIKYASNAFLATKISFINEIANVCEETGADVEVVAEGMGLDTRIGPRFLRPGVGYGGSCFPKDIAALKQVAGNSGYHFQLLNAVIEVNELQKRRILTKLKWHLGSLRGRTVALLGLAFKPDTNDVRDAPSLVLAARLRSEGAHVRAWDPAALVTAEPLLPSEVELTPSLPDAIRDADAALIVTEWDEVAHLPLDLVRSSMRTPLIVDGRNLLDPDEVRAAGILYEGIGRPSAATRLDDLQEGARDVGLQLRPSALDIHPLPAGSPATS